MCVLNGRTSRNICLSDALVNCKEALHNNGQGIALVYSPKICQFVKIDKDGSLQNVNQESLDLKDIFEIRAFNSTSELRWLNKSNGKGQAVLISESDISTYLDDSIRPLQFFATIEQEYILWGEGLKEQSNTEWGKLAKSRIGSISIPVTGLTTNKRVYLKAVEYLQEDKEYGNASVVEERLKDLEVK